MAETLAEAFDETEISPASPRRHCDGSNALSELTPEDATSNDDVGETPVDSFLQENRGDASEDERNWLSPSASDGTDPMSVGPIGTTAALAVLSLASQLISLF
jgi:hypothetical protein